MSALKETRKIHQRCAGMHVRASAFTGLSKLMLHVGMFIIAVVMLLSALTAPGEVEWVSGSEDGIIPLNATTDTKKRVADDSTVDTYEGFLLNAQSTRYAGRIWTDKSVYAAGNDGSGIALVDSKPETFREDFLEVFSAMGSTLAVNGEYEVPLDVMFVLDMSGSMSFQSDTIQRYNGQLSRLSQAIVALNGAFSYVLENEHSRVGLYVYSGNDVTRPNTGDGKLVMQLQHYTPKTDGTYLLDTSNATASRTFYGASVPGDYAWAFANASFSVNVDENTGGESSSFQASGGTNTQMGLYRAMRNMAEVEDTTVVIDGTEVKRKPVVILISDGNPTSSYNSPWWDPDSNGCMWQGPGYGTHIGNGLLVMATAMLMRDEIRDNYNNQVEVITFGIDVPQLYDYEAEFARTTLNPKVRLMDEFINGGTAAGDSKATANEIYNAFNTYLNSDSILVDVGENPDNPNVNWHATPDGGLYTFGHPTQGPDITSLSYNDTYIEVDGSQLRLKLGEILKDMHTTVDVPIEGTGELATSTTDMLSYSDPLGEYMDIKNIVKLRLFGVEYDVISNDGVNYTVVTAGTHEDATIVNPCYGDDKTKIFKLSDIDIWIVREDDQNIEGLTRYTLRVDVPSAAVPVRMAIIDLDKDKNVENYETNIGETGVEPLRLFYTVGMQDKYLVKSEGGNTLYRPGTVDLTTIDDTYKQQHRDPVTGQISFYANYFEGGQYIYSGGADYDRGNALTTFSPNSSNRYYIYQKYMPLYTDPENHASYVTSYSGIRSEDTYYFDFYYYTNNGYVYDQIRRIGSMFGTGVPGGEDNSSEYNNFGEFLVWYNMNSGETHPFEDQSYGEGWVVATKVGGIRVGNMGDHSDDSFKDEGNKTQTSTTYYLPTVSGSTTADNVVLTSFLGNNGVLTVSDSEIMVTKEVIYDQNQVTEEMISELKAKEKFEYTLKLEGSEFTGHFTAIMVTMDAPPHGWRALINKIELQPSNQGLLVSNTGRLYVYEQNGQEYYVYIGGNNQTPVTVFDSAVDGSLRDDGKVETPLSITGVKLLPKNQYTSNWSASNENNVLVDGPEVFSVGQIDETKEVGAEVSSPYKIKTTYQTKDVYFDEGIATFELNHLTGLLFTGLSGGTEYEVQENVTKDQTDKGIGLNHIDYERYNKNYDSSNGTFSLVQIGNTYTVVAPEDGIISGETRTSPDGADHVHYFNDYIPASLEVPKKVIGMPNDGDRFKFEITLTAPDDTIFTGYYAAYIHSTDHEVPVNPDDPDGDMRPCLPSDHESLQFKLSGKTVYKFVIHDENYVPPSDPDDEPDPGEIVLKGGESFVILGLPAGTKYEINEVIVSGDERIIPNYKTTVDVTNNEVEAEFDNDDNENRTVSGVLNSIVYRAVVDDVKSVGHIERVIVTYTNNLPMLFPATGGTGVRIFYVVGGLLLILPLMLLFIRKRHV